VALSVRRLHGIEAPRVAWYDGIKEIAMIELTEQQGQALATAENPTLVDPRTKATYVLVRTEVFNRIKRLLYDAGDWTAEEQLQLLAESGKRAGWDEPGMNDYDNYDESRRKQCQ
jgi:hypothetical protein